MTIPEFTEVVPIARSSPWSANRQRWVEAFSYLLLLAGGAALWWQRARMSLPQQAVLWALLLVGTAVLFRHGWSRLFGPVLFYDLLRLGRRSRFFLVRCLYAVVLFAVLYWTHERFMANLTRFMWMRNPYGPPRRLLEAADLARLAETFFFTFMTVQFLAVLVLTPGYTASAVAEEKDRKTLEFLLATDLRSREIVLSKLLARVANLTLLILTGLPILSLTQFLGGVDPNLLAAGFVATGVSLFSLAGFGILCSVLVRKPRDAILLTYLGLAIYFGVSSLTWSWTRTPGPLAFVTGGNVFLALKELYGAVNTGTDLATVVPGLLRDYAIFHGLVGLTCTGLAVWQLRPLALSPPRQVAKVPGRFGRPRVGRLPMVWKEVFIEPGFRFNWAGWIVAGLVVLLSLAPLPYLAVQNYSNPRFGAFGPAFASGQFLEDLNLWARVTTAGILCLMLVGVAVRAAGSVSGERDKETMDGLLTSPLQSHDILFAKWLGSFLCVRWAWLWLALIYLIALVTGGLHPFALPMQMSAWVVYAGAFAGLGLWFSTSCATTTKATMWTLGLTGGVCTIHWLLWFLCCGRGFTDFSPEATLTPMISLFWLGVSYAELGHNEWDIGFVLAMFGLMAWALVSAFCWTITRSRFRRLTARMPYRRPDRLAEMPTSEVARRLGQRI